MSDEQQTPEPGQVSNALQLSLREYLEISRRIFLTMAAMKFTTLPDCYLRLANEAKWHVEAIDAAVEHDANEIAERYDRQLELDCMQFWDD